MRIALVLLATVAVAVPAPSLAAKKSKDKVVRVSVGPFTVDAKRDREVCQAIRIPKIAGMELAEYEVRSKWAADASTGSHHLVIYAYSGGNTAQFPTPRNARDVVDSAGCAGFGPDDFFRRRVQLAGSGGEFRKGRWAITKGQTPGGLATIVPGTSDPSGDAVLIVNSHYFNTAPKAAKGVVKIAFRMRPFDGSRRVVTNHTPLDASLEIFVPPGSTATTSHTFQLDGQPDDSSEGGFRPDHDVCVLLMTSHTHKRGTNFTIHYEEDGQAPVPIQVPASYDYEHPPLITFPYTGRLPEGNLMKAYTAENGFPRFRYTCTYDNNGPEYGTRMGCEESAGTVPGTKWSEAIAAGRDYGNARPCGEGNVNCQGFGTGACVPSNLVFGPLSDDDMCVLILQVYDPKPGVPEAEACNPF